MSITPTGGLTGSANESLTDNGDGTGKVTVGAVSLTFYTKTGADGKFALAGAGGGSLPWTVLSLTPAAPGGASVTASLASQIAAAPSGSVLIVPPAGAGNVYPMAGKVTVSTNDLHFVGMTDQYDVSSSTTGGATFRDTGAITDACLFEVTADHASFQGIRFIANTAANAVLDGGASVIWRNCGFYAQGGTSAAPGAAYNGNDQAGGGQARCQLIECDATAGGNAANLSLKVGGSDFILNGGRYTGGAKVFLGTGVVCSGAHFTGDSTGYANLHNAGQHNTFTDLQIDTATNYALIYNSAQGFELSGCNFYCLTQTAGAALPCIISDSSYGPKIEDCTVIFGGSYTAFSYLINYVGGSTAAPKAAATTKIKNISGLNMPGVVTTLWNYVPGDFAGLDGYDPNGNHWIAKGTGPEAAARKLGLKAVTCDPASESGTAPAVGTTVGTNLISGTLYVCKVEHPDTLISAAGLVIGPTAFAGATVLALPVIVSDGVNWTTLGTIDLLGQGVTGVGDHLLYNSATGTPINWTIARPEMDVYLGFVHVGATAGAIRIVGGSGNGGNWLLASGAAPRFAVAATGITSLATIPASGTVAALSTSGLPAGPFIMGTA